MACVWKIESIIKVELKVIQFASYLFGCSGFLFSCIQYDPANKPPHTTDFSLYPTNPTSEDAIRVDWLCPLTDPNRWDYLDVQFQWFYNGCEVSVDDPEVFPAWRTRRDDIIDLEIRVWDGLVYSALLAQTVVIVNSPPKIQVDFYPNTPRSGEAVYVDWWISDADGDDLNYSWNWLYNDVVVPIDSNYFPKNITKRGDRLGIRFRIYDGIETIEEEFYVDVD